MTALVEPEPTGVIQPNERLFPLGPLRLVAGHHETVSHDMERGHAIGEFVGREIPVFLQFVFGDVQTYAVFTLYVTTCFRLPVTSDILEVGVLPVS